jgi:hypothetical protein
MKIISYWFFQGEMADPATSSSPARLSALGPVIRKIAFVIGLIRGMQVQVRLAGGHLIGIEKRY